MSANPKIATLLLAAGNSTRMGAPKQLLPWKNSFLLNHAINNAVQLEQSNTVVVLGSNYELIKPKIQRDDVEIIHNATWKLGLGNSIAFGVNHIQKNHEVDGILIVLADQPLVGTSYLKVLVNAFESGKNQIITSDYGNKKLGVPALFDALYFEELSQLNQDKGAKKVITNHLEDVLMFNAKHLIADIDTKEDYERLYEENH